MDPAAEKTLDRLTADSAAALGDRLLSLVLYGSAAAGDFIPGRSDLNLLFLLDRVDAAALDALSGPFHRRKKVPVSPLLLDRDEFERSQDSFPLEFLDLRLNHRIIRGEDPRTMIHVDCNALRLQCERETRGKVILLQQEFLLAGADRAARESLLAASVKPILAIMRGMLYLNGTDEPPRAPAQLVPAFEEVSGHPTPHFRRALDFRLAPPRLAAPEMAALFAGYIAELKEISRWVDRWEPRK